MNRPQNEPQPPVRRPQRRDRAGNRTPRQNNNNRTSGNMMAPPRRSTGGISHSLQSDAHKDVIVLAIELPVKTIIIELAAI
uniref:Uncharacterized protein n=1 Tax=Meloidogyne incognita TaxID=6306 RepID=A0A914P2Y2_MELIC